MLAGCFDTDGRKEGRFDVASQAAQDRIFASRARSSKDGLLLLWSGVWVSISLSRLFSVIAFAID